MTPREAEHDTARAIAEAKIKMKPFPPFSGNKPTCTKCRHHHIIGTTDKYDPATDSLDRKCINCGFTWVECSADSGSEGT